MRPIIYFITNILYRYFFPLYRVLYFVFKRKNDSCQISLLNKLIKPGDQVLDIGANIGFYSFCLLKLVQTNGSSLAEGMVHAFEPDTTNFKHLKALTKKSKNIIINNIAVSDKKGTINLYKSKLLNFDHRIYAADKRTNVVSVETNTIDNYVASRFKISFIKIDIQGAEMSAFKGMSQTIDENSNLTILTELWPYYLKLAGSSIADFEKFFKEKKFNIYFIKKNTLQKIDDLSLFENRQGKEYFNLLLTRNQTQHEFMWT